MRPTTQPSVIIPNSLVMFTNLFIFVFELIIINNFSQIFIWKLTHRAMQPIFLLPLHKLFQVYCLLLKVQTSNRIKFPERVRACKTCFSPRGHVLLEHFNSLVVFSMFNFYFISTFAFRAKDQISSILCWYFCLNVSDEIHLIIFDGFRKHRARGFIAPYDGLYFCIRRWVRKRNVPCVTHLSRWSNGPH